MPLVAPISPPGARKLLPDESVIESRRTEGAAVAAYGAQSTFNAYTPYEVFDREHRVLRDGVAGLRSALVSDQPGSAARLAEHVDTVKTQLAVHFAFEEDVGFMHYLRVARPGLVPGLDRLRGEHGEILATLERVSTELHRGLACADVCATINSVLEQLANHELDEQRVLRSALRGW